MVSPNMRSKRLALIALLITLPLTAVGHPCLELLTDGKQTGGMCEFDERPPDGFWAYSSGPEASSFILGPVPPTVDQVRLRYPHQIDIKVPAKPLPALPGISPGRYFVADADPSGSIDAISGTGPWWTVTPLDASGRPVDFTVF